MNQTESGTAAPPADAVVGRSDGAAAAAVLAAGIGSAVLGATVVGAVVSPAVKDALNWWDPVGPLAGKTGVAVLAWLVSWGILHLLWRGRAVRFGPVWGVALALVVVGFVLTFPPVFDAFEAGH
ncbi:MAG: hypothetical protein HY608_07665 [Planctomycetes bacterium]|nr:hypothetical protein [Planctomycetota bacterium]